MINRLTNDKAFTNLGKAMPQCYKNLLTSIIGVVRRPQAKNSKNIIMTAW